MKTAKINSRSTANLRSSRIAKRIMALSIFLLIVSSTALVSSLAYHNFAYAQGASTQKKMLRIGYFPNVNHAQAIIGFQTGDFEKQFGDNVDVQTITFNAGPSAIEALLAKRIDATYVGSNPAINGYIASGGKDLRIISGAAASPTIPRESSPRSRRSARQYLASWPAAGSSSRVP